MNITDEKVNIILDEAAPVWGVCSFKAVENHILNLPSKSRIPKNARSVIIAAFPYNVGDDAYENAELARFACVNDYHRVILTRLERAAAQLKEIYKDEEFVCFTDVSPLPEVELAVAAGIGVRGRNNLLLNPVYGSWISLGEIVTTLHLPATEKSENHLCNDCGLCTEACPTKAMSQHGLDRSRCIAALTQKKGSLSDEEAEILKNHSLVWGCDACQKICPANKNVKITDIAEYLESFNGSVVLDDESFNSKSYSWRGKDVLQRNMKLLENKNSDI